MSRYIPPGRDELYRRAARADAEVRRLFAVALRASERADALGRELSPDDPVAREAGEEADQLVAEHARAVAVSDRLHDERTAGLSAWIDANTHLPVCSECAGTGGPPGSDARTSCRRCRGWGREDDGRGRPPVWSDDDQAWIDPATGRTVDVPEPTLGAPSPAEVHDAERRADGLARTGAAADQIDAADDETERLHQARVAALREAERAEKVAADADDAWDANPTPETEKASRDAGQRADEAWRRAGLPECIPPQPTGSATTSGGTGMASIEEVRAGIAAANQQANEGLGVLQQAHASIEQARGALMHATEGSGQADATEAVGLLSQALAGVEEVRQQLAAAVSAAESVQGRL